MPKYLTSNFTKGTTGEANTNFLRRTFHGKRLLNFVTDVCANENSRDNVTVTFYYRLNGEYLAHCETWGSMAVLTDYLENRQRTLGKPQTKSIKNGITVWGWE